MRELENKLPDLLKRMADQIPPPMAVPPELTSRSRRRILRNGVLAAAVVTGLAIGSVTAFRAVTSGNIPDRRIPATEPTRAVGKIALTSADGFIYLVDSEGGGLIRLAQGEFPSFSLDGTRIAFTRNGQVHVMNADGTGITRVTDVARAPSGLAWSPDGTRIAFVGTLPGEEGLIIVDPDGGAPRLVGGNIPWVIRHTAAASPGRLIETTPSWSPDGTRILVDAPDGFYLIDVESGDAAPLAEHQSECGPWNAAYSPDGTTIAFTRWQPSGESPLIFCRLAGIFLMDADGTNVRRLANPSLRPWGPAWSPDGTRVAFFHQPGGPGALYVMNVDGSNFVDGSNLMKLGEIGGGDLAGFLAASPSWSPIQ